MNTTTTVFRAPLAVAALVLTFAVGGATALAAPPAKPKPPARAAGGVPAPRILVIDRTVILRASKVGQDIVRQINGYTKSAESEFKAQGEALQKEARDLQRQVAILAPDVKKKKVRDFQAKQAAFQRKVQAREGLIQGGLLQAKQQVEAALSPILKGIMMERGANLLLDRNAIVLGTVNIDITSVAVQRLNQKLPSLKVKLVALPADVKAQMAQRR